MAFRISDYHDLVRLFNQHSKGREELRHLLLTPWDQRVTDLAEGEHQLIKADKRSKEHLIHLKQSLAELVVGQRQLVEKQKRRVNQRSGSIGIGKLCNTS